MSITVAQVTNWGIAVALDEGVGSGFFNASTVGPNDGEMELDDGGTSGESFSPSSR